MLEDLIRFHKADVTVLSGYYYDSNRDYHIQDVIQHLFELRLRYKTEHNPLQQIIKLLLNSVYGKTILKPIDTETRFVKDSDIEAYMDRNYKEMIDAVQTYGSPFTKYHVRKEICSSFSFCTLGVNILSMSKRIMNEVFDILEANIMNAFYQDADSMHPYEEDVPKLASLYKENYGRDLIGKNLGQFHSDFPEF